MLKFDTRAKNALDLAQQVAQDLTHNYIGSDHLIYGILSQPQNDLPFQMAFIDGLSNTELLEVIRRVGIETMKEHSKTDEDPANSGTLFFPKITEELQNCLDKAIRIAETYNYSHIGLEHLIYGILDTTNSHGQKLMNLNEENSGRIKDILLTVFENYKKGVKVGEKNPKLKTSRNQPQSYLDYFTINLNKKIKQNIGFELVEREKEIERIIQILSRKTKNNPILLGEPGVGKTAAIEGLAKRILDKQVPIWLQDKQILSLDVSSLLAGTMFRGEFESRIKTIIEEVIEAKNVILFIDELHSAVGAGAGSSGGPTLPDILKPYLARGEVSVIGATTMEEYRTLIKKDKAFERRFQPVKLDEPDQFQVISILRGVKSSYENYHGVLFPDELVPKLVDLAERFVPERFFPDKAIDIMDECLVKCRIAQSRVETDDKEKEKTWVSIEREILELIKQKNQAILEQNFELSKKFEHEQKSLENQLSVLNQSSKDSKPKPTVNQELLEHTVSMISNVPVVRVTSNIFTQVKYLENTLNNQIFGQGEANSLVTSALKRAYTGVNPNKGPIASFLLLGPTGVGKTELVKIITKELYGSLDKYLLKLDMSEFSEKHTISSLIGAPAGYVGYEDKPRLTEFLRENPYSVILFDEIEKGSKDILNILLQMLEEGQITDSKGNIVSCRHAMIFMTSNLGRNQLNKFASKIGFSNLSSAEEQDYQTIKKNVMDEVEKTIKPEILGRITSKIVFRPIGVTVLTQIIHKELSILQNHLLKNGRTITFKDDIVGFIVSQVNNKLEYGAREVKSLIANIIHNPIAEYLLDNPTNLNMEIFLDKNKEIIVKEKKLKLPGIKVQDIKKVESPEIIKAR